jgi:hypothetical protein
MFYLLTQLPLVFLIVVATFIIHFFSIFKFILLCLNSKILGHSFHLKPVVYLLFLHLFLCFYYLIFYISPTITPNNQTSCGSICTVIAPYFIAISILRYYLQLHTLKICFILLLSALSQIAFIFMIGALSAWANHHGWHLNLG